MKHEVMTYDVVIVGAGPSGLAASIRLLQNAAKNNQPLKLCVLEKGAQVGAHLMSGAVLNPTSLKTLLPNDWKKAPFNTPVANDRFYYLTKKHAVRLPTPKPMRNRHDYFIISLSELGLFLAEYATQLGCEIYTGFAATEILYNEEGHVIGVATGDMGINKSGEQTPQYQPGIHIHAKQTLFAEGCRGQLSEQLMKRFHLRADKSPQTYGLGVKEIWKVPAKNHRLGDVIHTVGWPLDTKTYGGSFIYHCADNKIALGFITGLDYQNPWLSPFEEMQRFKTHPFVKEQLQNGERIAYGARAINEGGWQSLPKLTFPGGMLVGDAAGFLNVAQIKGIHMAIQSGILAADACSELFSLSPAPQQWGEGAQTDKAQHVHHNDAGVKEAVRYSQLFEQSWAARELYAVRNIRPGFKQGLWWGLINAAFETYITFGHSPWTLKNHADFKQLKWAQKSKKINYPKPDGVLTFDRLSSVYLTNTFHAENQPAHLKLKESQVAIEINYRQYASPEVRYCPAAVYEIVDEETQPRLHIHAQNCIHCKTCDIKDPTQNIVWSAPEGGGGPHYVGM